MVLEYSARHLALIEWSSSLKLLNFSAIGLALFVPWGLADPGAGALGIAAGWLLTLAKLGAAGAALALIESFSAKLRIFRAPEFLATAFLLAVLGLLVHQLLGS
jgi:formate hydrogenlyase subunit 4